MKVADLDQAAVDLARAVRARRGRERRVSLLSLLGRLSARQAPGAIREFHRATAEERAADSEYRDALTREAAR